MLRSIIIGCLVVMGFMSSAYADTQTKSWFMSHPEARARVNTICQDSPGTAKHNANCLNAAAATEEAGIDGLIARTGNPPTLFQQCATMPPLFQIVNHCGAGATNR